MRTKFHSGNVFTSLPTLSGCSIKMLWKRERPRDMTHLMDFSLPYWKPYNSVKKVDIPLMDNNRNQATNTNHQGSQKPPDLFFFILFTGVGLGHREERSEGMNKSGDISTVQRFLCLLCCVDQSADQHAKWLLKTISVLRTSRLVMLRTCWYCSGFGKFFASSFSRHIRRWQRPARRNLLQYTQWWLLSVSPVAGSQNTPTCNYTSTHKKLEVCTIEYFGLCCTDWSETFLEIYLFDSSLVSSSVPHTSLSCCKYSTESPSMHYLLQFRHFVKKQTVQGIYSVKPKVFAIMHLFLAIKS